MEKHYIFTHSFIYRVITIPNHSQITIPNHTKLGQFSRNLPAKWKSILLLSMLILSISFGKIKTKINKNKWQVSLSNIWIEKYLGSFFLIVCSASSHPLLCVPYLQRYKLCMHCMSHCTDIWMTYLAFVAEVCVQMTISLDKKSHFHSWQYWHHIAVTRQND